MDTFSALFYRAFKIANDPDEHEGCTLGEKV